MLLLITVSFYLLIHCAVPQGCPSQVKNNPNPPSSFAFGSHTSSSVVLSWSPTIIIDCIKSYNIMSNTSNPDMTTTATQATLSVTNEPPTAKYCAMVATISTSNKMGIYSEPVCFILDVPAFIMLTAYEWNGANLTLHWMSNQDDRPQITAYYLSLFDAISKQVLLSLTLSGDSTTTTISDSMLSNNDVVTVTLIAANVLGNNTGSQVNVTLVISSVTSSLLSALLPPSSSSSLSSSLPFVPSSTTTSKMSTSGSPQPPLSTTLLLPSVTSTESRTSVTISTIISTMTTKLISSSALAATTSLSNELAFTTSSSLADVLISTTFLYESVSPGSIGPVVGGIVALFLLIILIVSIIVTIVFVCRVKKISKSYSLKDEAVTTNDVHIYDDVCEIDEQPEFTQRELASDYQEPQSIIRKVATSTGSLYTVHQRKTAVDYTDLSFPNNAASRQPSDVNQPSNHDYDEIGRFSSSFDSPERVEYSETSFQVITSSLPPPNIDLPEDNYSDMPGRINYISSEEPPNMNHDDNDYDDII